MSGEHYLSLCMIHNEQMLDKKKLSIFQIKNNPRVIIKRIKDFF